ncbi:MAG: hypothetical protein ACI9U2_000496 [Bradymonadia bacterium]|jgi:hypothetical protein
MVDAHHDDHALPPPEPDDINAGNVFFWGVTTFVVLIVCIALLGSYFWAERLTEDVAKINEAGAYQGAKKSLAADLKQQLTTYKKHDDGHVQIPIEQAMKLIVKDYAKAN